jgi:hypothetical protein
MEARGDGPEQRVRLLIRVVGQRRNHDNRVVLQIDLPEIERATRAVEAAIDAISKFCACAAGADAASASAVANAAVKPV